MIGIVADDTTGANDIGIMFSKHGYLVKVVTYRESMVLAPDCDVLIIDTDSRLDSPQVSYDKVYRAVKELQMLGCATYHKKTCSVFRGNAGQEFDAMLDALREDFMVISLAFPKNGRQTAYGMHTVHGMPLEQSEFANDPVHPMRESGLVSILQKQTSRKVGLVDLDTVRQGAAVLRSAINEMRAKVQYCIVDSVTQEDLNTVAEAVKGVHVLGGSSAIGEELPKFWPARQRESILSRVDFSDRNGVLIVSGSLMPQTKAQTDYLIESGVRGLVFDSRSVFSEKACEAEIARVAEEAAPLLAVGQDVLVMANNEEPIVLETKRLGKLQGLDPLSISKSVSAALAKITARIVDGCGLKRLVIAGGDTSGTICRRLGIQGNFVLREIETGLPSGLAIGREMLIVLKSGSFGGTEFLAKAINHLKGN